MSPSHVYGRYALYEALGRGGAASVYLGVARGDELAPVAVKVLHEGPSREAGAVTRLLDEVRLSRLIVHPNVVRVIDFVSDGEEMLAVMEYVHGEPLSRLLADARRSGGPVPIPIAAAILCDVLRGLHAAHEARSADGTPLELVHRDVTPENMLVGADGISRLSDFGVAKAQGRLQKTHDGGLRGKIAYSAPEQIGGEVTRKTDIYAAGLVLWEVLVSERPIQGDNEAVLLTKALDPNIPRPSTRVAAVGPALDAAVMNALHVAPEERFATALALSEALEQAVGRVASASEVGAWVHAMAGERLAQRATAIAGMLEAERPFSRGHEAVEPSVASRRSLAPRRRPRIAIFGVVVTLLASALVVMIWYTRQPSPASDPIGVFPDAAPAIASATGAPSATGVTSVTSVTSDAGLPGVTGTASAPSQSASAHPRVVGGRPPVAPKCDPPWLIDSRGIRRYNPDCLK